MRMSENIKLCTEEKNVLKSRRIYALFFLIIFTIVVSICLPVFGEEDYSGEVTEEFSEELSDDITEEVPEEIPTMNVRGRVVRNLDLRDKLIEYSGGSLEDSVQHVEVRITSGEFKGELVDAEYPLSLDFVGGQENALLRPGNEVLMTLELDQNGKIVSAVIYNPARDKSVILLLILFVIVILSVGRLKGFKALVALILTILTIMYILLPLLLRGYNPVFTTVFSSVLVTGATLILVGGFNKKALAAILGATGGVVAAGIISAMIGNMAKLTGLGSEESQMLLYIPQNISFDYKGLLFAGIILGALGACMDVAMSMSSAMFEIKEQSPELNRFQLFKSGMNIGRDMMGTMANTLIMAYVGGSLPLLMLFIAHNMPVYEIINQDGFAGEIIRSIAGSIGLILTIPLTALTASILCEKNRVRDFEFDDDMPD